MGCFVVAEFLLTSLLRGHSAIAELLVLYRTVLYMYIMHFGLVYAFVTVPDRKHWRVRSVFTLFSTSFVVFSYISGQPGGRVNTAVAPMTNVNI